MKRQLSIIFGMLLVVGLFTACTSDSSQDDPAFEEIELAVEFTPKDALIVLDRSKSMVGNDFLSYVAGSIENLTIEMADWVNFGLMIYPGVNCDDTAGYCDVSAEAYVPCEQSDNVEAINDALGAWETSVTPCGATPTAATLDAARAYFSQSDNGAEKLVILITDGAPNCSEDSALDGNTCTCTADRSQCIADTSHCLDDAASSDAAAALLADGIPVYVLSLGDGAASLPQQFSDAMNSIASAGGTTEALAVADVALNLEEQVNQVRPDLYSCEVGLDWAQVGELTRESKISSMLEKISLWGKESKESLIADAEKISYDPGCPTGAGFDLTVDDKISLCASSCNLLKESKISDIAATAKESKISKESKESSLAKESAN